MADSGQRDNTNYVPESSRRARAVPCMRPSDRWAAPVSPN